MGATRPLDARRGRINPRAQGIEEGRQRSLGRHSPAMTRERPSYTGLHVCLGEPVCGARQPPKAPPDSPARSAVRAEDVAHRALLERQTGDSGTRKGAGGLHDPRFGVHFINGRLSPAESCSVSVG